MRTFHLNDTTLLDFSQDAVGGNADVADESGVPDDVFNVQQRKCVGLQFDLST